MLERKPRELSGGQLQRVAMGRSIVRHPKDPVLASDARYARNVDRVSNVAEIETRISTVLAKLDREAAIALLTGAGIACGRLSTTDDLAVHPQARRIVVDTPTGPADLMGRGVKYEGMTGNFGRVPALGKHGQRIREEFPKVPADASHDHLT